VAAIARLVSAAVAVALVGAACSGDDDGGEPAIIDVGQAAVGVCLDVASDVGAEITELPTVECTELHTHEIFAVVESAESVYPGFEALETEAQAACLAQFEPYVGVNAFDSELFYSWLVPTLNSWEKEDDREIICVVGNGNGAPLIGSVAGSRR
jgi:hypothetical protein